MHAVRRAGCCVLHWGAGEERGEAGMGVKRHGGSWDTCCSCGDEGKVLLVVNYPHWGAVEGQGEEGGGTGATKMS